LRFGWKFTNYALATKLIKEKMKFSNIALLSIYLVSFSAFAGPFTDNLSMCLVRSASDADKEKFMKWTFVAMSKHPAVKEFSNITPEKSDEINQDAGNLLVSLLVEKCKKETNEAVRYEGANAALTASFEYFGSSSIDQLMSHPAVTKYISGLKSTMEKASLADELMEK
jgi:hypothetical protein